MRSYRIFFVEKIINDSCLIFRIRWDLAESRFDFTSHFSKKLCRLKISTRKLKFRHFRLWQFIFTLNIRHLIFIPPHQAFVKRKKSLGSDLENMVDVEAILNPINALLFLSTLICDTVLHLDEIAHPLSSIWSIFDCFDFQTLQ